MNEQLLSPPKRPDFSIRNCYSSARTVLVADDDALNLMIVIGFLELDGFNVLSATDGAMAVEEFRCQSEAVDLAILDFAMPVMNGRQTLDALRSIKPDLPAIVVSGLPAREVLAEFEGTKVDGFIHKPFRRDNVRSALFEAIGFA